ncbi:MAG: TraB/GumN family protein [Pontiellaceae bacterium]|nr:TraB/GumN family protein [Pontiellaceae bacterium]MBN2784961.1 TraB/GumN family protein [Pontiellaceae bacterium]
MKRKTAVHTYLAATLSVLLLPSAVWAKSCLWKASLGEKTIYLQGSIHSLKPENYPLAEAIQQAYQESDTIFFEADIGEMHTKKTQDLLLQKATYPSGHALKTELSEESYRLLQKELAACGISETLIQNYKPWFVSIMIMGKRFQNMGLNPELGLDKHLYEQAVKDGKKIDAFETIEFQFSLFESLSDNDDDAYTRYFIKDMQQGMEMLPEIIKAWTEGNLDKLNSVFMEGIEEYPEMYDRFVTQRNKAWMKRIEGIPPSGKPVMIVVGAAHLADKEGLVALLKARGYTVEQL